MASLNVRNLRCRSSRHEPAVHSTVDWQHKQVQTTASRTRTTIHATPLLPSRGTAHAQHAPVVHCTNDYGQQCHVSVAAMLALGSLPGEVPRSAFLFRGSHNRTATPPHTPLHHNAHAHIHTHTPSHFTTVHQADGNSVKPSDRLLLAVACIRDAIAGKRPPVLRGAGSGFAL